MKAIGSESFWKTSTGVVGLVVVLAILIAANIILSNLRLRVDMTEENLYTLSDGSRHMLESLDRTVTLKLFSSASARETPIYLKTYAGEIRDLLAEYAAVAKGKLVIEEYDPKPDSDEEEWAQRYGVAGQPIGMLGPSLYLGLVAVSADREQTIPALDPRTENLLEYNITRLIYRVAHPEKPVLAVMSSLPVMGVQAPPFAMPGMPSPQPQPAWMAFADLKQDYELRELEPTDEEIDADIETLVLVHPKELSPATLYAIDQFVMRGGRLIVFLDPFSVTEMESAPANPMMGMNRTPSNLEPLLKAWGIGYDPTRIVADFRSVSRISTGNNQVEESPVWLSFSADNVSKDDILTSQLEIVMLPFAGAFLDETGPELTFTPLLTAGEGSGRVNASTAQFGGNAVRREFMPETVPLHVAARLSGKFQSAYPDGKPKAEAGPDSAPEPAAAPAIKQGESSVLLVADADMLNNRFCVEALNFFGTQAFRPINDNLSLFNNAVEQMTGSSDLIGIRSRGKLARQFERVVALQQKAMNAWREQEAALEKKLQETQQLLQEMEQGKQGNQRFILSEDQRKAIDGFRDEERRIKQQLKEVRKSLRSDIERLGVKVKVINIALMPLVVILAGIGFWLHRKTRK